MSFMNGFYTYCVHIFKPRRPVSLKIQCRLLVPAEWQFYLDASMYFSCLHCSAISWLTMTSFSLKSAVYHGGCHNKSGDTNFHKFFACVAIYCKAAYCSAINFWSFLYCIASRSSSVLNESSLIWPATMLSWVIHFHCTEQYNVSLVACGQAFTCAQS